MLRGQQNIKLQYGLKHDITTSFLQYSAAICN